MKECSIDSKYFDQAALMRRWKCGRTTLFALRKSPSFPPPFKLLQGGRKLLWSPEVILAWEEARRPCPPIGALDEPAIGIQKFAWPFGPTPK